jgi:hypothetical protein
MRPMIYEMKKNESVNSLLKYSGGLGIGAWSFHFAHHIDHNGLSLSYSEFNLARTVSATQRIAKSGICLSNG